MAYDFEVEKGVLFGDWLHEQINEAVLLERNGYFPDQVKRVADRLQAGRPSDARLIVEVPWIRLFTAFTAPGRYMYFSRRLLERCPDDETVAFVIAHELAHHDLSHMAVFSGRFSRHAARFSPAAVIVLFFRLLQQRVYSPRWETAADLHAIELCVAAGYDGRKCLRLFDVLEKWALYHMDFDAVYGLDKDSDQELAPDADFMTKARIWLYLRRRGYLPIQDRRALVAERLDQLLANGHYRKRPAS